MFQELVQTRSGGVGEISINWTKRYLLKSLQYLGPIAMSIGSFILIIACVVTLESRDKNTQILRNMRDERSCEKRKSVVEEQKAPVRVPMTAEQIRDWRPRYRAVPLIRRDSSPRKCCFLSTHAPA
ncbi:unnamed protein product [Gongylonema pulchrum]|uniref:Small integral membrane protein 29 n=1 Tax=Gongylonema pulchrum TaxID=637853 RepID=A0A183EXM1_9BILA|nr:unnamed protein product [Gongylonema pulchrum]